MTKGRDSFSLSKSKFMRGLQCQKALYLTVHQPELAGPVSAEQEAIFESGSEVGELAHGLFPGGVFIPYDRHNHGEQIAMTKREIDKGTEVIYEAAFSHDGVFVKADILRMGPGGWEIYEVKSSASMKDYHVPDVAVQYYVLAGSGLGVSRAFIVHINNEYVRRGAIELEKLFTFNDVTADVEGRQGAVREEIARQKAMLAGDVPAIDIGPYCTYPFDCDFHGHCWRDVPEVSVFSLKGNRKIGFSLYGSGVVDLRDVDPEGLPAAQRQQLEAMLGEKVCVLKDEIRKFLDSIRYPVYFLDFETFLTAIPPYDGIRPYQQVPYQYSLHRIEHEGGPLKHSEYLAPAGTDPREGLARKLMGEIPEDACVIAYVAGFEKGVLGDIARWFPEYAGKIGKITGSMIDLAYPFQKRLYYHWQFNGSYSLKAVLPVIVPGLSYDGMEVSDGGMAMEAYFRMQEITDDAEMEKLRKAMLEYCKLDTFAMVRVLDVLKSA